MFGLLCVWGQGNHYSGEALSPSISMSLSASPDRDMCAGDDRERDKRERGAANGKLQIGGTACGGISPRSAEPTGPLWSENARMPHLRMPHACRRVPTPKGQGTGIYGQYCVHHTQETCLSSPTCREKQRYVGITEYVCSTKLFTLGLLASDYKTNI